MKKFADQTLPVSLIISGILILNITVTLVMSSISGTTIYEPLGVIGIASVVLFIILCILGLFSESLYFTFLLFIFIAFPSIVDNIIPGIVVGVKAGNEVAFPLFTHIDIYLLLGVIKGVLKQDKIRASGNGLLLISIIVLFSSYFYNTFFNSDNIYEFSLLSTGSFYLRYLLLIYFIFIVFDVSKYKKSLINGVYLSIIFLFIESSITTYINGGARLSSGTLNLNTLGNITAQIGFVLALIGIKFNLIKLSNIVLIIVIILSFYISIATETRIAILSVFGVMLYLYLGKWKKVKRLIGIASLILASFVLLVYVDWSKILPPRYYLPAILQKTEVNLSNNELNKIFKIKLTSETSSLITRLDLFQTSFNMIKDNPVMGLGANRWNYKKNNYGSKVHLLINSHNGYLNVVAENGIFSLFFLFLVYFYPVYLVRNKIKKNNLTDPILYFSLINLGIALCDFSNSTINKHSVYALLIFNSIYLIFSYKDGTSVKAS